ncbi:L,D-transpeptidase [Nocardioides sp. GY 10113]|uniref:L,D-transpeptidase n=1 Tax=Nocardioides sp. GY 10113 TaxID=2569761 RepID=UPI0010A8B16B|nr:L,D-transpeptidase [Nocardioides sp. GY 10113]TIC87372.1 L,D-transpeptidase [Nocardioides sp. GY 10113]
MRRARPTRGSHRAEVRPRYGRIGVALLAAAVTVVALLGALGLYPTDEAGVVAQPISVTEGSGGAEVDTPTPQRTAPEGRSGGRSAEPAEANGSAGATGAADAADPAEVDEPAAPDGPDASTAEGSPLPEGSGTGTRVVFSESRQRVWLVESGADGDAVVRTYPVSGSTLDNLFPGTYAVYSRSRHAIGIDDSGTMEYFVRFTQGTSGAAIGFHTIPVKDGRPLQTRAELGSPRSHGCIRQARADAVALWRFAPEGTTVVVTA